MNVDVGYYSRVIYGVWFNRAAMLLALERCTWINSGRFACESLSVTLKLWWITSRQLLSWLSAAQWNRLAIVNNRKSPENFRNHRNCRNHRNRWNSCLCSISFFFYQRRSSIDYCLYISWRILENHLFTGLPETPKDSQRLPKTPKDSQRLPKTSKDFK